MKKVLFFLTALFFFSFSQAQRINFGSTVGERGKIPAGMSSKLLTYLDTVGAIQTNRGLLSYEPITHGPDSRWVKREHDKEFLLDGVPIWQALRVQQSDTIWFDQRVAEFERAQDSLSEVLSARYERIADSLMDFTIKDFAFLEPEKATELYWQRMGLAETAEELALYSDEFAADRLLAMPEYQYDLSVRFTKAESKRYDMLSWLNIDFTKSVGLVSWTVDSSGQDSPTISRKYVEVQSLDWSDDGPSFTLDPNFLWEITGGEIPPKAKRTLDYGKFSVKYYFAETITVIGTRLLKNGRRQIIKIYFP